MCNILKLSENLDIDYINKEIKNFECRIEKEVEKDIREKVKRKERAGTMRTYLFIYDNKLLGYVSICLRTLEIEKKFIEDMDSRQRNIFNIRKIDNEWKNTEIPIYHIASLGLNDKYLNMKIDYFNGWSLLKHAFKNIFTSMKIIGTNIITLEVKIDNYDALKLYEKNGFIQFGDKKYHKDGWNYTMIRIIDSNCLFLKDNT